MTNISPPKIIPVNASILAWEGIKGWGKDYVIVYYNFGSAYQVGLITINDINGRLLRSYSVNQVKNQIILGLTNFPDGFYIIGLYENNRLFETEKLIKGRE